VLLLVVVVAVAAVAAVAAAAVVVVVVGSLLLEHTQTSSRTGFPRSRKRKTRAPVLTGRCGLGAKPGAV